MQLITTPQKTKPSSSSGNGSPENINTLSERLSVNAYASRNMGKRPTSSKRRGGSRSATVAFDPAKIEKGVELILQGLGVDLSNRNYLETPERVARFYSELFKQREPQWETFPETYCNLILLKHHRLWTLCPHHLLPVRLTVSLAYIPSGAVLGLSKLARLTSFCNNSPLLQEEFTSRVVKQLRSCVPTAKGVAAFVEGKHSCASIRGIRTRGEFVTYTVDGDFEHNVELQRLFFSLVRRGHA